MNELISQDTVKAQRAHEAILSEMRSINTGWVRLAIMLSTLKRNEYWRPLGFSGFDHYLGELAFESKGSFYKKVALIEDLSQQVPVGTLQLIPITNCTLLKDVPPSKRVEMAENAKTLSVAQFASMVEKVPGNGLEGREGTVPLTFVCTVSQRAKIDEALTRMMEEGELTRRADALEFICVEYLNGNQSI